MPAPDPIAEHIANLRSIVARLSLSAGTLSILGAALDAKVGGTTLSPELQPHFDGMLQAMGARASLDAIPAEALRPLLAEIRVSMLHGASLLFDTTRADGWSSTNPDLLRAAGDTSAGFIEPLSQQIVPKLAGLEERLQQGGDFLDIGCGIAALSIAVARKWPNVRVVGVDPWGPSMRIARENVRAAGVEDRITLLQMPAEELSDEKAFDLAWVPSPFIPPDAVKVILGKAFTALRPGGWILFATVNPGTDEAAAAFARLRTALWGGGVWSTAEMESLLKSNGFVEVRALPAPPGSPAAMIAGRRAE